MDIKIAKKLAINGGQPIRSKPMPTRALIGEEEKAIAMKIFDEAIVSGSAFGYGGAYEQQYDKDFADFMGGGFADGVNSGTNAVYCALGGLQLDALSDSAHHRSWWSHASRDARLRADLSRLRPAKLQYFGKAD